MEKVVKKEIDLGGKKLVLETGELAGQANAAVVAQYGETVVLSTVVSKEASPDVDYFPLAVDYEEKLYAGGKISTSRFIKREGRPTEVAILTSRLIDRSIRPLFPKDYQAEVQVIITVLSVDQENSPDIVALIATSAALSISDIPWNGPLSGLRIGRQNGGFLINPTDDEREFSNLDLILSSTKDEIVMIEAGAQEVEEKSIVEALKFGLENGKQVIGLIEDMVADAGREKQKYEAKKVDEAKFKPANDFIEKELIKELEDPKKAQDENWFHESLEKLEEKFVTEDENSISKKSLANLLDEAVAQFLRKQILEKKKRIDGRGIDDIRPLNIKVGLLPRTHGSAIFQRGKTQILSIATLASPSLQQLIESMEGEETKKYMHHYNFPPFSTGEVRRIGSPGRREIGHGALAERALFPVLPAEDIFPYTIRVVSEVLSSAGSTSMAAASGSTLALMDAGVPLKEPVSGISIGLITDLKDKSNYVTIVDIAYQEDAQGDMDFKVAGSKNGVTAIQMDIKLTGITLKIAEEALEKAKKARLFLLAKMLEVLPAPRETISKHAPTVIVVKIDPSKIGDVIGSGGRVINRIISETGAGIDVNNEGIVTISGKDPEACKKAATWVEGIVKEAQVGEEFEGTVKRILPFGAMVEYLPGKEGLVHISKLASHRVERVEDVVKIGQSVEVRVAEIDDQGRINLAMKGVEARPQRENFENKSFDRDRRANRPRRPHQKRF